MKSLCGEELGSETGRDGGGRRPEIPAAAALCGAAWRRECDQGCQSKIDAHKLITKCMQPIDYDEQFMLETTP